MWHVAVKHWTMEASNSEKLPLCYIPSRQLTVNWQPTMLKFHKESDFHLPQSQNCLLGTAYSSFPMLEKIVWPPQKNQVFLLVFNFPSQSWGRLLLRVGCWVPVLGREVRHPKLRSCLGIFENDLSRNCKKFSWHETFLFCSFRCKL